MEYQDLIQRVQSISALTEAEIMQDRGFKVHFKEEKVIIFCELDPDQETLALYSLIGQLPDYDSDAYLKLLIEAHLFGRATSLSYFGYDEATNSIYLFRTLNIKAYEPEAIKLIIKDLFLAVKFWRETLKYGMISNDKGSETDESGVWAGQYFSKRI